MRALLLDLSSVCLGRRGETHKQEIRGSEVRDITVRERGGLDKANSLVEMSSAESKASIDSARLPKRLTTVLSHAGIN